MAAVTKFIVGELNKPPLTKNYNLISFDSLSPEVLLQVLNDVFAEIDEKNSTDIREEDPEQMAVRMLGMLRMLKYKPPEENKNNFRSGLVAGEKYIIHPIMQWLLERMGDLKKRSYLAKYLVKLDIPSEMRGDADVDDMVNKCDELIEQFKEVHREFEGLKNSGFSTSELRKDITMMEEERDLVTKRIERMKQKTEGIPNQEGMLEAAKKLRQEKERLKEMSSQEADLKQSIQVMDQRISRLETQLKDLRKASIGATPEGLLQRLEEEVNVNSYIVKEKMPKELVTKQKLVATLQRVVNEPAMGQEEIENIKRRIAATNQEINSLNESRMKEVEDDESSEGKVGKLSFFRQNAAIISRKKEQAAERFNELRNELINLEDEIREKQAQLKEFSGDEVLRGDDFKLYINKLRGKSSTYKMKKAELNDLRAEFGILSRTEEILKSQDATIDEQLSQVEANSGVSGFRDTQDTLEKVSEMKAQVDEKKGVTLTEMSEMVRELNFRINERKASLAPLLKEVRPLREKLQNFTVEYTDKKSTFDSIAAGLESNMAKLEHDVKGSSDEIIKMETKYHMEMYEKQIMELKQKEIQEEIKIYLSKDPQEKKKSVREQLINLVADEEKQGLLLKEEQKTVKDLVQNSSKQLTMWQDVIRLMELKRQCYENVRNRGQVTRNSGSEALVL